MNPMTPYGAALLDYFRGDKNAAVIMYRDDDTRYELPAGIFFNDAAAFSVTEKVALDACRGKVLDAGAGTGRHSLWLKENGFDVHPIDISPEAVEIMKERGLHDAQCTDILEFNAGLFDTILLLGHGIGLTGTLSGFRKFLDHAKTILNPDGIIIFDTLDVRFTKDQKNLDYQERNISLGRYIGEIRLQFEYKGVLGEPHFWLHIDPDTLEKEASAQGWKTTILHREETGDYLVKMEYRG